MSNDDECKHGRVVQVMLDERRRLMREIEKIDRFLRLEGVDLQSVISGVDDKITTNGRPRNDRNKRDTIEQVLLQATAPLAPREIVAGMIKLGYRFASTEPVNTLNPLLYGPRAYDYIVKLRNGIVHKDRLDEFQRNLALGPALSKEGNNALM